MRCSMTSPDGAKMVAIGVCYDGPLAEGERLIAPVRQFGPPLADQIRPMAYTELQSMLDADVPPWAPVLLESPLSAGDQRRRH